MTDFNDYTEIRGIKYYNWVKRITQAHLAGKNSSTLCGMAMLGSNYARHFEQQHWNRCEECYNAAQSVKLDDAGKLKAIEHMIEEENNTYDCYPGSDSYDTMPGELRTFITRLLYLLDDKPVKIPMYQPDAQTLCVEEK